MKIKEFVYWIGYATILNNAVWWLLTMVALVRYGTWYYYEYNIFIAFPEMLVQIYSLFFTLYLVIDYLLKLNPKIYKKFGR